MCSELRPVEITILKPGTHPANRRVTGLTKRVTTWRIRHRRVRGACAADSGEPARWSVLSLAARLGVTGDLIGIAPSTWSCSRRHLVRSWPGCEEPPVERGLEHAWIPPCVA